MRAIRRKRRPKIFGHIATLATGAAAAALIISVAGFFRINSTSIPSPVAQTAEITTVSPPIPVKHVTHTTQNTIHQATIANAIPTLAGKFHPIDNASEAYRFVRTAFDQAKTNKDGADFFAIIALCDTLITRWPDSDESLQARKLISRCHTQTADHESAKTAFLAYADEAGERKKSELLAEEGIDPVTAQLEAESASAKIIFDEVNHLFKSKEEYLAALSYADMIFTRYSATAYAQRVRLLAGEYCLRTRQPAQAAVEYEAIIAESDDVYAVRSAMTILPTALFNSGRRDDAIVAWLNYADASASANDKACAYYNAGALLAVMGKDRYQEAMHLFQKVLSDFPQSNYVRDVKRLVSELEVKIIGVDSAAVDPLDIENMLEVQDDFYLEEIPGIRDILGDGEMIDVL